MKNAKQKFNKSMVMGNYLTKNMKLSLINMTKRANKDPPSDLLSSVGEFEVYLQKNYITDLPHLLFRSLFVIRKYNVII